MTMVIEYAAMIRGKQQPITQHDYEMLAEFRFALRNFLNFSETAARQAGLTPRQHQALLAVKGFPPEQRVTIGDLAERLVIHHNSAVELVNRLAEAGLISRETDAADRRRILISLTAEAEERLASLSAIHLEELRRLRPVLQRVLAGLE
jgi:DNA-binding MarR family transcriptional regulator